MQVAKIKAMDLHPCGFYIYLALNLRVRGSCFLISRGAYISDLSR
jgi:hypothetical protein